MELLRVLPTNNNMMGISKAKAKRTAPKALTTMASVSKLGYSALKSVLIRLIHEEEKRK